LFLVQCNNPLTKEPKLDAARRIVPEWVDYDSEIMALWDAQHSRKDKITDSTSSQQSQHSDHTEL